MEYMATDSVHPHYKVWQQFVNDDLIVWVFCILHWLAMIKTILKTVVHVKLWVYKPVPVVPELGGDIAHFGVIIFFVNENLVIHQWFLLILIDVVGKNWSL